MNPYRTMTFVISWIVIFILFGYGYFKYIFWEPSQVERDSLIYWLKIPTFAKNYPTWNEYDAPLYDLSNTDGNKPRVVKISYMSTLDIPKLITQLNFKVFKCSTINEQDVFCSRSEGDSGKTEISFKKTEEGTEVTVVIIEDYQ